MKKKKKNKTEEESMEVAEEPAEESKGNFFGLKLFLKTVKLF